MRRSFYIKREPTGGATVRSATAQRRVGEDKLSVTLLRGDTEKLIEMWIFSSPTTVGQPEYFAMTIRTTEELDILYEVEVPPPKKRKARAHRRFRTLSGALRASISTADKRTVLENLRALEDHLYENDLPLLFIEF